MSAEVHFVLQGKGGVGKSVVARMLIEYFLNEKAKYIGFDADPVNQSLAAVTDYDIKRVELMNGSEVDPRQFDEVMSEIESLKDTKVIMDCGASSFLPIIGYIDDADAIDTLIEAGYEVFVHTVVTGGPSKNDTFTGYSQLKERFAESCNIVVWTNPIFGVVEADGTPFHERPAIVKSIEEGELLGVIQIPKFPRMNQQDFAEFLELNTTFSKATSKTNTEINSMVRRRLLKMHGQLMFQIDQVLKEEAEEETEDAS